jgi:hypothetical protein
MQSLRDRQLHNQADFAICHLGLTNNSAQALVWLLRFQQQLGKIAIIELSHSYRTGSLRPYTRRFTIPFDLVELQRYAQKNPQVKDFLVGNLFQILGHPYPQPHQEWVNDLVQQCLDLKISANTSIDLILGLDLDRGRVKVYVDPAIGPVMLAWEGPAAIKNPSPGPDRGPGPGPTPRDLSDTSGHITTKTYRKSHDNHKYYDLGSRSWHLRVHEYCPGPVPGTYLTWVSHGPEAQNYYFRRRTFIDRLLVFLEVISISFSSLHK